MELWNHPLFNDFSEDLKTWLGDRMEKRTFKKGELLFSQGDPVLGIFVHLGGLAKIIQKDEHGKIEFSRLVLPGDSSGHRSLFIENSYKGSAEVLSENLEAVYIRLEDVSFLLSKSLLFTKNIIIKISTELSRSEEDHVSKNKKSVRGRIANLILELCENYADQVNGQQYVIKSEISKREIAKILLISNETVIRVMSEMKQEKIIDYQTKKLHVLHLQKLGNYAKL